MAITITNSDGVIFTFNDGDVESISRNKSTSLEVQPMPLSDSDNTYVVDFGGVTRRISVNGHLNLADSSRTSSGSVITAVEQDAWLDALQNGNQTGCIFNDGLHDPINIFIMSYNSIKDVQNPNGFPFSFEFVEGEEQ